jgi:hypothetical protein
MSKKGATRGHDILLSGAFQFQYIKYSQQREGACDAGVFDRGELDRFDFNPGVDEELHRGIEALRIEARRYMNLLVQIDESLRNNGLLAPMIMVMWGSLPLILLLASDSMAMLMSKSASSLSYKAN